MRSIRNPHRDDPAADHGTPPAPSRIDEQCPPRQCCPDQRGGALLWLGDLVLALGCFAAITAAGQLPLTAPRLFQAISSVRIATAAKRSAAQRETKDEKNGAKPPAAETSVSKLHMPTVVTLN